MGYGGTAATFEVNTVAPPVGDLKNLGRCALIFPAKWRVSQLLVSTGWEKGSKTFAFSGMRFEIGIAATTISERMGARKRHGGHQNAKQGEWAWHRVKLLEFGTLTSLEVIISEPPSTLDLVW